MVDAWLIYIPPEYDGIDIIVSAITYILNTEPDQSFIFDILGAGGTVTKIQVLGGETEITVKINGSPVSLDSDENGDYFTLPDDDYDPTVEIDVSGGGGESNTNVNYTQYQPYNVVIGNTAPSLPLWSAFGSNNYLYKIDNDSGSTLKTVIDSDLRYLEEGSLSNFVASDDGYLYFFLPLDEGYPIKTHIHLWVYDPAGTGSDILDHYASSGGLQAGSCFIAFDRVQEVLYAEFEGTTSSSYTTLYKYSKTGSLISSVERLKLNWTLGINCMAAYNGNVIYAHNADGGADPNVIEYGGSTIFSMSGSYSWVSNIVAPKDGFIYALYKESFSSGFHVIKVSPDTGLVWEYEVTGATAPYSYYAPILSANDSGVSMVLLSHSGTPKTTKLDANGNLVWQKTGAYRHIDNNGAYFQ